MDNKELIMKETEKTLSSIEGIKRAEVNPFLLTKIQARLNEPERFERTINFKLALSVLVIFTLLNVALYIFVQKETYEINSTRQYNINSLSTEYFPNNNIYFY